MLKSINHPLIGLLVEEGFKIVVIRAFDEVQYWNVSTFTPNYLGSEPIEYCVLKGVNITPFVDRTTNMSNPTEIIANLIKHNEGSPMVNVTIPKTMEWQWFTA